MASSLPLVRDSIQEALATDFEDRLWERLRQDEIRREKEKQLQRLREQVEAAIDEAPHLERQIRAAQDLLEEEYSKWMANQEEDATKKGEMNPWKDEA